MAVNLSGADVSSELISKTHGLVYIGTVTTATDSTHFASTDLAGFGNDYFCSASYADWEVFVVWDGGGAGAAPQGLLAPVSDYVSNGGTFTHSAFTSGTLAVGDKVILVNPILAWLGTKVEAAASGAVTTTDFLSAYIKQLLNELLGTDGGWTNMNNAAVASLDAGLQVMAGVLNVDGANQFSVSLDGTAYTNLDTVLTALGSLIGTKSSTAATGAVTTTDDIVSYIKQIINNTYLLAETADGEAVYPASVAADSILAKILGKGNPALASSFDNTTDSLEAIRDVIDTAAADVANLDGAAMRGTDNAALASVVGALNTAAATGVVTETDTIMAYLKQRVTQGVSCMTFASAADDIIVIPATGADLDFPNVVVAGLPTGCTILRVDMILVIGALNNTSAAENQIKTGTTDAIYVKKSTGAWGTDDISALVFPALGLQTALSAYRGGAVFFGATDLTSEVDGNATYNFRSEETNRTKGVEATGATLELLDVTTILRVWFN